jgi:hypothetical protein
MFRENKETMKRNTIRLTESQLTKLIEDAIQGLVDEGVIHKEGDSWKIRGKKSGGSHNEKDKDWKADYSSKEKAQAVLRGYFANKGK